MKKKSSGSGGVRPCAAIYLRVSTDRQSTANQRPDVERLCRARRLNVPRELRFEETASAARTRPAFVGMLDAARRGEFTTLVVWALDRFGRSMGDNVRDLLELDRIGVQVISVRESWLDTSSPEIRKLMIAILSWVAEQERVRLGERTRAGLARARAKGTKLGRPKASISHVQLERARSMIRNGESVRWAAKFLSIPPSTLRKALKR